MLPYSISELLLIALIMTFGSVVQGAVGFASGLLGIPLLVLSGLSLAEAATINLISTSVQNVWGAAQLWSELDLRETWLPVTMRWLTVPLGVLALEHVNDLDQFLVKQILGCLLLVVVLALWTLRIQPRERLHPWWQVIGFGTSGFLLGFASIGGAPMVIYVNSLRWSAAQSRGFLFYVSATGVPITAPLWLARLGSEVAAAAFASLLVMPAVVLGLLLGLRLGREISKPFFRRITFLLLVLIALSAMASPWLSPS